MTVVKTKPPTLYQINLFIEYRKHLNTQQEVEGKKKKKSHLKELVTSSDLSERKPP